MITLTANIYVSDTETIEINQHNLKSIEINISDREDVDEPSWGVISNTGKLSFYDSDMQVLGLIQQNVLGNSNKIEFFINNTLVKVHKSIGVFYPDKWTYDNDSHLVSVTLKDDLQEWQSVVISQVPILSDFTYLDLYYQLLIYTPPKFKIVASQETLDYLSSIRETNDSKLEGDTLWARWQQFCEATMLHIYKNDKGEVVISNHK